MPLQQLVEYFNDRLELEQHNGFRPFLLNAGEIKGLFGQLTIGSRLTPVRHASNTDQIVAHTANLEVTNSPVQPLLSTELDSLIDIRGTPHTSDIGSIIHFDRLSRTVHMLNYLPVAHADGVLILDVDPRHILGVKTDHGAYFEEIIVKCGLRTQNVGIALNVTSAYLRFFPSLLKGLENYQRRGYKIVLKIDPTALLAPTTDFIERANPDVVSLNTQQIQLLAQRDKQILSKLQQLSGLLASIQSRGLLQDIDDKHTAAYARLTQFDWVHGQYFEQPITSTRANFEKQNFSKVSA